MGSVLVVNPGTHPEPLYAAIGLANSGLEVDYATGASIRISARTLRFALRTAPRVGRALRARALPDDLPHNLRVITKGLGAELVFQALKARASPFAKEWMRRRTRIVGRAAARLIRNRHRRKNPYLAVIAQQTAATIPFEATTRSVARVLMQPIVDQSWLSRELELDRTLNPDWGFALQGLDRSSKEISEIALELDLADALIAGSELVARSVAAKRHIPTIVSHYGADLSNSGPARTRSRTQDEPLRIVFGGQVNQRKGISYLLAAVAHLSVPWELSLIGPISEPVREKIRESAGEKINIIGPVARSELHRHFREAHVLVLPSLGEGFALVVVEAMATGLPCIASEHAGSHEVIRTGDNGVVVAPRSATEIRRALEQISNPETLARMSARASESVKELTWARFGNAVANGLAPWLRQNRQDQ